MPDKKGSLAEAILLQLLEQKEMASEQKEILRNLLTPMVEYMESADDPMETALRITQLQKFLAFAVAYGIMLSSKPDCRKMYSDRMGVEFDVQLTGALEVFIEAEKLFGMEDK